jgi:hypothetical protein
MSKIETLEQLAQNHPYYCSGNYYSNEPFAKWNNWSEFYNEWHNADVDMNMVFRWDISNHDDDNLELGKYMRIIIIQQRKGILFEHHIQKLFEYGVKQIVDYLEKHWQNMQALWNPILSPKTT